MPTFPTQTRTLSDKVVAAMETYIRKGSPADVIFSRNLLLGTLFNSAKEPGVAGPLVKGFSIRGSRVMTKNARELWIPVQIGRSSNTTAWNHLDTLSTNLDTGITRQYAKFARYTDFAGLSWTDELETSGEGAMLDLWQTNFDRALATMSESMEGDIWSTNTDTNETTQKEVIGLQHLIADDPTTGTVWGIDRSTYTWQRNQATTSAGSFASGGLDKMDALWVDLASTNGIDPPSVILTTPDIYTYYEKAARAKQQINDNNTGDLGIEAIRYKGRPLTHSSSCPSGKMYFLNLNYFYLINEKGNDFKTFYPPMANNQLVSKQVRFTKGFQWGCERFDRQGVIAGITA